VIKPAQLTQRWQFFLRKGRMTISVTAQRQGFTGPDFSAQFFHTQTGVGFQRNAGCAIHHEPYPMDPGRSALSPGSWSSAGQAGHTSSGETKYHD